MVSSQVCGLEVWDSEAPLGEEVGGVEEGE